MTADPATVRQHEALALASAWPRGFDPADVLVVPPRRSVADGSASGPSITQFAIVMLAGGTIAIVGGLAGEATLLRTPWNRARSKGFQPMPRARPIGKRSDHPAAPVWFRRANVGGIGIPSLQRIA